MTGHWAAANPQARGRPTTTSLPQRAWRRKKRRDVKGTRKLPGVCPFFTAEDAEEEN
jgi:hypothetical protein